MDEHKEGIQKAAHNILPKIVKKNKKPWISTDILRHDGKTENSEEHPKLR